MSKESIKNNCTLCKHIQEDYYDLFCNKYGYYWRTHIALVTTCPDYE